MLIVRELGIEIGARRLLSPVSFTVGDGEKVGIVGRNGAGKSTLLKVISARMRPTAGSVAIGDLALRRPTPAALAKLGVCAIPEGRGIFPNLTVRENLLIWSFQGVASSVVEEVAYDRFPKLKERRRQLAGTLSGGEQQMLAIARALAGDPKVLLLDELSMGLAPLVVAELYDLVGQIAARGVTVVLVEQFVTTALMVATDAAIMLHGAIHATGSPVEMGELATAAYLSEG